MAPTGGHHRPTNHNRWKTPAQGAAVVKAKKNGVHRSTERVDTQNNILLKDAVPPSPSPDWDMHLPIPQLSPRWASCLVAALSLLCYLNSCRGDFVFDDTEAVLSNKDVRGETPILETFGDDFWGEEIVKNHSHKSYRPLTVLSFRLNYLLSGGFHPLGFHLTNVLLHTLVSVISLRVFSLLFSQAPPLEGNGEPASQAHHSSSAPRASLLSSLLFTCHPIHTESVAGIVGRADLLCALFFFLSFSFYVSAIKKDGQPALLRMICCMLCCAISMLCKEQGITIIGVCIVYDVIVNCELDVGQVIVQFFQPPKAKASSHPRWPPGLAPRLCALVLCAVVLLTGRFLIMGSGLPLFQQADNPASFAEGILTRMTNYNLVYALNLWLLVFPHWLCFDWSMGCVSLIQSASDVRLLAPIAFWGLLGYLLHRCIIGPASPRRRMLTMSLSLLVIPYLPAANLFLRVGFVVAERVLYLPSLGFCMLLTLAADWSVRNAVPKKVVQCVVVVVLAYYVQRCIGRNQDWATGERLYKSGLDVCPNNAKVHYNIANNAAERGNVQEAIQFYRQAISLNPLYDQAMNNLANLLKERGELTQSEALLSQAVQIKPQFAAAWMNLGIVQAASKKYTEAERSYKTALVHRHRYADCYFNLGNMYVDTGRHDDALKAWRQATLQQADHGRAWGNLATFHERAGQYETAILVAKEAMKYVPQEASIYFGLGNVLGKVGRYEEAEESFLRAIQLNPRMANYHGNLGVLYHRWGKFPEAKEHYSAAMDLDPNSHNARDNLKKLLQKMAKEKSKKPSL